MMIVADSLLPMIIHSVSMMMLMMVTSIEVDYGIAWLKEVFRYPQNGLNLIGLNFVCFTACLFVSIHICIASILTGVHINICNALGCSKCIGISTHLNRAEPNQLCG